MPRFSELFYRAIQRLIMIAVLVLMISSLALFLFYAVRRNSWDFFTIQLTLVLLGGLFAGLAVFFLPLSHRMKLLLILIIAFLLRLWFFSRVPIELFSDYSTIYSAAQELIRGNFGPFHGFAYLARFPHLVPMSLYMAGMITLFPVNHLIVMRLFHLILSVWTVYLIYCLSAHFVRQSKFRLIAALIAAIYPAFISYSSSFVTENLSMPFFLLAMLIFLRCKKASGKKAALWSGITGMVLFVAHLFRGVGPVFVIAFLLYIFLFVKKEKIVRAIPLLLCYLLCLTVLSGILMGVGLMERPIWKGSEPITATAALRGSNIESFGMWNVEDASFVGEHLEDPDLEELCYQKVWERYSSTSILKLCLFFIAKFVIQWCQGDCSGMFAAFSSFGEELPYYQAPPFALLYCVVLLFCLCTLFAHRRRKENMIIYLLLCGFGTLFVIFEMQGRYSYIVCWAFILMAAQGAEQFSKFIRQRKNKERGYIYDHEETTYSEAEEYTVLDMCSSSLSDC